MSRRRCEEYRVASTCRAALREYYDKDDARDVNAVPTEAYSLWPSLMNALEQCVSAEGAAETTPETLYVMHEAAAWPHSAHVPRCC